MEELLPGVWHWTAVHPNHGMTVHSHAVGTTLIDPLLPAEGMEALPGPVEQIVLTNRHHYRSSGELVARFGCPVRCHEAGLHEFAGTDRKVEGFAWGDQLAPDITAVKLAAICPEETVLHIARGNGVLAFADGIVRWEEGDPLGFVPDGLLGEEPEEVKTQLRHNLRGLLDLDFDTLLLAHGAPYVGDGREALRRFLD
jgi:hypothetical protein